MCDITYGEGMEGLESTVVADKVETRTRLIHMTVL